MQPVQSRSPVGVVARYIGVAANRGSKHATTLICGIALLSTGVACSVIQAMIPAASFSDSLTKVAFACAGVGITAVMIPCLKTSWIGQAALPNETLTGKDVSAFLRLLPVLFSANLAFSSLYNSMQFWYQQQACQMDVRLGSMQLSGSFFNIADCFAIVIMTPLAVDWINPILDRKMGKLGHSLKFGIGMAIAGISVLTAARLEQVRKGTPVLPMQSNCAPPGVSMSDLKGAWMMVPYFLMGVAEIYTQPTLLHFAYSKSPASMRTLSMAASFFIQAVSSALFALLVKALSSYIPNDLNNGHLEYGYYANMALGLALFGPFLMVMNQYDSAERNGTP